MTPYVDAHLDQFGRQSGGYGSPEQLANMHRLAGALRVLFCERNGKPPPKPKRHLHAAREIRQDLMPAQMPPHWQLGQHFHYHVEGLESAQNLPDYLELLRAFHTHGVRGCTPIYHVGNPLGGCSKEPGVGLTPLGHAVLQAMWKLGWWVDLAHMSERSMYDTLEIAAGIHPRPRVCYTHGAIWHPIDHPALPPAAQQRCISLDLAHLVVRQGGLVCLSPAQPFYPNLGHPFLDHLVTLGEASAWRGVGIGTDYGGILDEWRFPGCNTVLDVFQRVEGALRNTALTTHERRAVLGENVARFFNLALPLDARP